MNPSFPITTLVKREFFEVKVSPGGITTVLPTEIIRVIEQKQNPGVFVVVKALDANKKELRYNILNFIGKPMLSEWALFISEFKNGYAKVKRSDGLWNFASVTGRFVSKIWYKSLRNIENGIAAVEREDGMYNFLSVLYGKLISKVWFKDVGYFTNPYVTTVKREDGLWNFINSEGDIISKRRWFNFVKPFKGNFAQVQNISGKWNLMSGSGRIVSKKWFDYVENFDEDGLAKVVKILPNGISIYNFIGNYGKLSSSVWFKKVTTFDQNGYADVQSINGKWNYILKGTRIPVLDTWYKEKIPASAYIIIEPIL